MSVIVALALAAAPAGGSVSLFPHGGNADPAILRPAKPIGDAGQWLSASDFPASAFVGGEQTAFNLEVDLDAAGRIVACRSTPVLNTPDTALGERACALIRSRGRFGHALDLGGQPAASRVGMSVWFAPADTRYAGPPPAPPSPPPGGFDTRRPAPRDPALLILPVEPTLYPAEAARAVLDIDAKGRVERCWILASAGSDAGDAALCRRLRSARFEPARTVRGDKIAYPRFVVTLRR